MIFEESGIDFLNIAWGMAMDLLIEFSRHNPQADFMTDNENMKKTVLGQKRPNYTHRVSPYSSRPRISSKRAHRSHKPLPTSRQSREEFQLKKAR